MRNVTLSAEEAMIEAARARARSENSTLNEAFRQWLTDYANHRRPLQGYDDAIAQLRGQVRVGRRLSREEMNER